MGRQIHIQLNSRKFESIIRQLQVQRNISALNNNETVGFCLFYMLLLSTEKNSQGKTRLDVIIQHFHNGSHVDAVTLQLHNRYKQYLNGKNDELYSKLEFTP
jgi:hypothetical protein